MIEVGTLTLTKIIYPVALEVIAVTFGKYSLGEAYVNLESLKILFEKMMD